MSSLYPSPPSINHRIVVAQHSNNSSEEEQHHIVDIEDHSDNSSSGLDSPLSNSDPNNTNPFIIDSNNDPGSSSNHHNNNSTQLRKELYESVHFTNRILLIEGIYSFYLDDSIFVLALRVFQSILMYYSFVHSTQPTLLGRIFKHNMNLKKKLILVLIIVLPLLLIHISNYATNENYYSSKVRKTNLYYKKENEYFELIDFFEQENLFTYNTKKKIFDNVKVGVYFPEQQSIETHQERIIQKHFDMKQLKANQQQQQQQQPLVINKQIIEKAYETQQAIRIDSESITLFDNHPTLFIIYLCLFDIVFAIVQVSHVTTLVQLMKLLNNPNNSYFNRILTNTTSSASASEIHESSDDEES